MNISNAEQGLIPLPGAPDAWIWAFTCPMPECACRTAIVLSAPGGRETLRNRGRPVAEAWLRGGHYGQAALDLQGVTAFAVNLDTRALYPPLGDAPLDVILLHVGRPKNDDVARPRVANAREPRLGPGDPRAVDELVRHQEIPHEKRTFHGLGGDPERLNEKGSSKQCQRYSENDDFSVFT